MMSFNWLTCTVCGLSVDIKGRLFIYLVIGYGNNFTLKLNFHLKPLFCTYIPLNKTEYIQKHRRAGHSCKLKQDVQQICNGKEITSLLFFLSSWKGTQIPPVKTSSVMAGFILSTSFMQGQLGGSGHAARHAVPCGGMRRKQTHGQHLAALIRVPARVLIS